MCDSFSCKSCSRKETNENNLVHAEVILNKMYGWTADASELEQTKLGGIETNPRQQEIQRLWRLIATFNRVLASPHGETGRQSSYEYRNQFSMRTFIGSKNYEMSFIKKNKK